MGKEVSQFEAEFAAYSGATHGVGVASGTDALELGLKAVGVEPGTTVVTVANAGMYSTAAILACGARPAYVDIDPETLLLDHDHLQQVLARCRPAAVVVTHLYGQLVDMARVLNITGEHNIPVVEDCAQAHGATIDGRAAGSFADVGAFSFYPTKNLGAVGDGGIAITSQDGIAERLRRLSQYGWSAKYVASTPGGRNSRLDELQAAALRVLLPHLDGWNQRRREIVQRYTAGIAHPLVQVPQRGGSGDVGHLYVIRSRQRESLREHLRQRGIATDVHFPVPDHRQQAVRIVTGEHDSLPVTEATSDQVLSLPCFPELTDAEVDRVVQGVNAWPVN